MKSAKKFCALRAPAIFLQCKKNFARASRAQKDSWTLSALAWACKCKKCLPIILPERNEFFLLKMKNAASKSAQKRCKNYGHPRGVKKIFDPPFGKFLPIPPLDRETVSMSAYLYFSSAKISPSYIIC